MSASEVAPFTGSVASEVAKRELAQLAETTSSPAAGAPEDAGMPRLLAALYEEGMIRSAIYVCRIATVMPLQALRTASRAQVRMSQVSRLRKC